MVQTLSGNWWLWLVPLFLISLAVMIPASLSELGFVKRKKKTGEDVAVVKDSTTADTAESADDNLIEIILMAAAAYYYSNANFGGDKMKNLKITVNGKTYDVKVEEENTPREYTPRFSPSKAAEPSAAPKAETVVTPKEEKPAIEVSGSNVKAASAEGIKVEAPMAGRVVEITADVGTHVKAGDTIIVMEAMKLQSEICAECDGTVKEILVKEKQDITTGEVVAIIG